MYLCVHAHVHRHVRVRSQPCHHPSGTIYLVFEKGPHTNIGVHPLTGPRDHFLWLSRFRVISAPLCWDSLVVCIDFKDLHVCKTGTSETELSLPAIPFFLPLTLERIALAVSELTHPVDQAVLELTAICLSLPLNCWVCTATAGLFHLFLVPVFQYVMCT